MNDFDIMDALSGKRAQYTLDEIEKAKKKAKKTGDNILNVLQEMTGKQLNPSMDDNIIINNVTETEKSTLNLNQIQKDLADLNTHLKEDFSSSGKTSQESSVGKEDSKPVDADSFVGLAEEVQNNVFGQDAFLKKLVIAFKRPFVMPSETPHAKNCIFIYGPEDSGKHLALKTLAKKMADRCIISDAQIQIMDLSIYKEPGKDNVFLQDLYMMLQSSGQIIVFENYEDCHISYLTYLNDLVLKGECQLQDRYIMQKGQLINVNNSFASEAISTFTAAGKYIVFLGTKNEDSLSDVFGAPFVNALGDICASIPLDEASLRKIAETCFSVLKEKSEKQFSFIVTAREEELFSTAVAMAGNHVGTKGITSFFDRILKCLANIKLEEDYEKGTKVSLSVEDGVLYAVIGEDKKNLMDSLPASYTGALDRVKEELNSIVGLDKVKEYILSLEEYYHTQQRRAQAGLKASEVSKHMIFTGNPGTGKTTIARIVSRYLKAIGVLTGGQLVEVSRADLVGRYVGHTAPLVNQVIRSAIGGVLFIDEAYSLYRGKEDTFGLEAIDTLVKGIEDNRDNLIVILAGYSREMNDFLEANSGLKSRFPNIIDFPDYTGEELLQITKITVKSKGYILDEEAEPDLLSYYNKKQADDASTAGNGRLVRNKVEDAILNQSRRLVAEPDANLSLLKIIDFTLL